MIKRYFAAVLLALSMFVAADASATMNLRQNGDGTADWIGATGIKRFGQCAGGQVIQIPTLLSTNITTYGVSPATNAVVRGAYAVSPTTTTGQAILKVYVANQTTTPVRFFHPSNSLVSHATITLGGTAGNMARISAVSEVSGSGGLVSNALGEGDVIAIGSDGGANGGGTGASAAQVFVQICPR